MDSNCQGKLTSIKDRTKNLFEKNCWTDVAFAVVFNDEKEIFKAHKIILASASEVFERMFFGHLPPPNPNQNILIEDQIAPKTFQAMLKYIYTDFIQFDTLADAIAMLRLAHIYMLHALTKCCQDEIKKRLSAANAFEIYEFAAIYDQKELFIAAREIIKKHTTAAIKMPYLENISTSTLMDILKEDCLNITELQLFQAIELVAIKKGVIKKTQRDPTHSTTNEQNESKLWKEFRSIIKQIRFLSMTDNEFKDGPAFSTLLTTDEAFCITVCLTKPNHIKTHYPKDFTQSKRQNMANNHWICGLDNGAAFRPKIKAIRHRHLYSANAFVHNPQFSD